MNYNSDFKYDLEVGNVKEKELANILENKKIEIKYDLKSNITGNVFIEYESRGKPSGLSTTQSDYYAFILGNGIIIIIDTDRLKNISRGMIGTSRDILGGDSNTSKGILLKINELINL